MTIGRFFCLNGRSCSEFGVVCSGGGTFDAPELDIDEVEIPGRNGNLIVDNGRFRNITVTYPCFIYKNFTQNIGALRSWLLSDRGYRRLEDGYDADHFRMAQYAGGLALEATPLIRGGNFSVEFNCKPQRWLYSGELSLRAVNGQTLRNPTAFTALPRITVTGTGAGALTVGDVTVSIKSMPQGAVVLDSDTQDAYYGTHNLNNTILAPEFPVLPAGESAVSWTGGITGVEIIPRWWTL